MPRYTPISEVERGRSFFTAGRKDFMLFTERFHFFRRFKVKGARHILFYTLPQVNPPLLFILVM